MSAEPAVIRANRAARMAADDVHCGPVSATFSDLASYTARASGRPSTFALCCLVIVIWAAAEA